MNTEAIDRMAKIRALVLAARGGVIEYAEAKKKAQPLIDEINQLGKEKAKKYHVRFRPISFAGIAR